MFVQDLDYKVVIGEQALSVVTQIDIGNRQNAEAEAIEEISGYLRPKYDVQSIFAATGEMRNKMIVMYTCDIALYHMTAASGGRMGAEVRQERYDKAIKWLESVQSGKIVPDLPLATDTEGKNYERTRYGSAPQLKSIW